MTNLSTVSELLKMLEEPDAETIINAAQELVLRSEKTATPFLLDILRSTNDIAVRNTVAIALSDLKDPQAFNVLVDLVNNDKTKNNRGTLLYALGAYDCSTILSLLIKFVIEGNFEVSHQALSLISEIETEIDDVTWNNCIKQLQTAIAEASKERRPLLVELLSNFKE